MLPTVFEEKAVKMGSIYWGKFAQGLIQILTTWPADMYYLNKTLNTPQNSTPEYCKDKNVSKEYYDIARVHCEEA